MHNNIRSATCHSRRFVNPRDDHQAPKSKPSMSNLYLFHHSSISSSLLQAPKCPSHQIRSTLSKQLVASTPKSQPNKILSNSAAPPPSIQGQKKENNNT